MLQHQVNKRPCFGTFHKESRNLCVLQYFIFESYFLKNSFYIQFFFSDETIGVFQLNGWINEFILVWSRGEKKFSITGKFNATKWPIWTFFVKWHRCENCQSKCHFLWSLRTSKFENTIVSWDSRASEASISRILIKIQGIRRQIVISNSSLRERRVDISDV